MKFLITGSSSGIGKELVTHLLKSNHHVIGLARNQQEPYSGKSIDTSHYYSYDIDFKELEQVTILSKKINKEHSDIDVIIINAGYGDFKELEQFSEVQIIDMFKVNIISPIFLIKQLLAQLKKGVNKKIIFIGSEAALNGSKKGSIYCATKFALRGFMQSLRQECKNKHIAVTLINPAMVKTNFYDKQKFTHGDAKENYINTSDITKIIDLIINLENNLSLDEINLTNMQKLIKFKN
jgi:3-hydroxy acid dehydrogenase/malonic semialdehyde reductase